MWRSAVGHLRERGHEVRVLTTDYREPSADPSIPEDDDVHRELRWYWRDHEFPPHGPASGSRARAPQRRACSTATSTEFRPDVGELVGDGRHVAVADRAVRRAGVPAAVRGRRRLDAVRAGRRVDARAGARLRRAPGRPPASTSARRPLAVRQRHAAAPGARERLAAARRRDRPPRDRPGPVQLAARAPRPGAGGSSTAAGSTSARGSTRRSRRWRHCPPRRRSGWSAAATTATSRSCAHRAGRLGGARELRAPPRDELPARLRGRPT